MKIYVQDCNWRGSIVVIANNLSEAIELMKNEDNHNKDNTIVEH